ncbi:MAG: phage major capsid protein [Phreatobacter sp.]|nr:phage major capsid protein [Phreatobacter sp.]
MNAPMTPGLRAAIAAGRYLHAKDGTNLDPILKAIEDNNKAVDARLKPLEGTKEAVAGVDARLLDIEQKMARGSFHGGRAGPPETWGAQFTQAEGLKAFAQETSRPGRFRLEMKTTLTTSVGSGGTLGRPARDELLMLPQRALMVRDLLPVIQISTGSVEYPRQTERPSGADTVTEGNLKPESAMSFDLVTVASKVIAHWIPASRQILEDVPQLAGIIDSELRYGLAVKEDSQLLYGSGTGPNLTGMVTAATAYAAPMTIAAATMIDQIALAILQTGLADLPADGIVLHPSDWMRMRLAKNGQGDYILGAPGANVEPRLFGLPVVPTTSMQVDKFLVGNFRAAATLYDRWAARVEVATEHADFFVRNLVAILAEERLALAIKRPTALVYGDFGNVP